MALIKCKECGKDISESATSCPSCGNPNKVRVVLTEQTSKKWKIIKLIGGIIIIIGVCMFYPGCSIGNFQDIRTEVGFNLIWGGILIIVIGKMGSWWSHK